MTPPNPLYRCVGVDPGKHTGVAGIALYPSSEVTHPLLGHYRVACEFAYTVEFEDAPAYLDGVVAQLAAVTFPRMTPPAVVVEKFVATQKTVRTQEMYSVEVTGMVRSALSDHPTVLFKQYKPSETKPLIKDKTLRELGVDLTGTSTHARDAMRQGVRDCVEMLQRGHVVSARSTAPVVP